MKVTINSDGALLNGIGGWAYWIEGPGFVKKDAGLMPGIVDSSSVSELEGFTQALDYLRTEYPDTDFEITFFCDNLWVVRGLKGDIRVYDTITKNHILAMKRVYRDVKQYKVKSYYVTPHTDRLDTPEKIANNWCDFNARELTRREFSRRNGRTKPTTR